MTVLLQVEVTDSMGSTPLHRAASKGHLQATNLLVSKGADVNAIDGEGNTPLHLACECEAREVYTRLVEAGARKDIKNKAGKTPLETAIIISPAYSN